MQTMKKKQSLHKEEEPITTITIELQDTLITIIPINNLAPVYQNYYFPCQRYRPGF